MDFHDTQNNENENTPPGPSISFCVLTCNRDSLLQRLLEALHPQTQTGDEILVLDTGGSNATRAVVTAREFPRTKYHAEVMQPFNFAIARNRLLQLATCDLIAFIDDDAAPLPGWVEQIRGGLLDHLASGGATLASASLPPWWDPAINWCIGLSPPGTVLGQPGFYPDTCNMAARRDLFERYPFQVVQRKNGELYTTGREDAEWWSERRLGGLDVVVNFRQTVLHTIHPDRLSLSYIRQRARNDGAASWQRQPTRKAATDIPWDLAHIAAVVFFKFIRRPFDLRYRLADTIWMQRQWGKFVAVWNSAPELRPRKREQLFQLAHAAFFQAKIRLGHAVFAARIATRKKPFFPPTQPKHIFVSADCFLGDSVLLRRHIHQLGTCFPGARILVSARYPWLFSRLAPNITVQSTATATAWVTGGKFTPDAAIVPYFPFGDIGLWRKTLSPVGATFTCDVSFPGRRDYQFARRRVSKCMEIHEHENLARLFNLWHNAETRASAPPAPEIPQGGLGEAEHALNSCGLTGVQGYVVAHLGSGHLSKDWPAESWAHFLQLFSAEIRTPIILVGDSGWNERADAIVDGMAAAAASARIINLCGGSVEYLAALVSQASFLIGGCSGPKHLAVEMGIPTFTLYAASEPERWGAADEHWKHGYVTALPQKLSGLELQQIDVQHRAKLLNPDSVARAAINHFVQVSSYQDEARQQEGSER